MNTTRILLADEDEEFLEIMQSFLFPRGFECLTTRSVLECLALIRRFKPEVLVLDDDLRRGGGVTVLCRMQKEPAFGQLPVIFTGGEDAPHRTERFLGRPVVAQLTKPFSLHQLLTAIHRVGRWESQEVSA
jgi:CheY-like chemotaxis protein